MQRGYKNIEAVINVRIIYDWKISQKVIDSSMYLACMYQDLNYQNWCRHLPPSQPGPRPLKIHGAKQFHENTTSYRNEAMIKDII